MRRSLPILMALLCLSILGYSQKFYTVHVGTFVNAKSADFDPIRKLGFVHSYPMDGDLTQVFLGGYDDKAKAQKIANDLKVLDYNAYVMERDLKQGRTVTIIQIATRNLNKNIDWPKFESFGQLYAIVGDNKVKIATGIYNNVGEAKSDLAAIKKSGFKDAFVKKVNDVLLVKLSAFETRLKKPLIPLAINKQETKPQRATKSPTTQNTIPSTIPRTYSNLPSTYNNSQVTTRSPEGNLRPKATRASMPAIRGKVKRGSVLELQKVLKQERYYTSSLDGYYGKGTSAAYDRAKDGNQQFKKYELLSAHFATTKPQEGDALQVSINNLLDDPSTIYTLERSKEPVAQAYRAYLLFRRLGPSAEVNGLMNTAIRAAYEGKRLGNQPPFDYRATYAYEDLNQLILHIHFIHAAPDNDYGAPCWLAEIHPRETAVAHTAFANYAAGTLKLAACDQFLTWEEIRTMGTIANDLDARKTQDKTLAAAAASRRAQLFMAPLPLDKRSVAELENWNRSLWQGLNAWAAADPLHKDIVTALKISYFQSQVRLEDYFMDQGFKVGDAKGLALATLESLVGYQLQRFI